MFNDIKEYKKIGVNYVYFLSLIKASSNEVYLEDSKQSMFHEIIVLQLKRKRLERPSGLGPTLDSSWPIRKSTKEGRKA